MATREQRNAYGRTYRRLPHVRLAMRDRNYRLKYGITLSDYESMLSSQNGRCAICSTDNPGGHGNRFHVDHNHITGAVRGLLCTSCNVSLGGFRDSPILLDNAIKYIRKPTFDAGITEGLI